MLHCAPLAGQLMLCPCVNGAQHLQHGCMSCVCCCRCVLVCGRVVCGCGLFAAMLRLLGFSWMDLLEGSPSGFLDLSLVRGRSLIPGRVCKPRKAAPFGWRSCSFSQ